MKINQNTFETEFGKLTIGFPPDWDLEEYIHEAVYGEEKMEIRRFSAGVAGNMNDPTYAERYYKMSPEDITAMTQDHLSGKGMSEKGWELVKRSCQRDEKYLRLNFRVMCPTERLLRDLIYWCQEDEDGLKVAKLVRGEMLRLIHFLRKLRGECQDPTLWGTTADLPFPEGGVPMSGHPKAPEAFFRLWHIAHHAEEGNRGIAPGEPDYAEYVDEQGPDFEKGVDPIYIFNDLPSSLVPWHDNWGDVSFKMERVDGESTDGKAPCDYVPKCEHGRRMDSNCNDCKKEG